jgi:serine/threonine-protein kinase
MPLPPQQVGPYLLEELIGSGGMGAVYRASRNDGLFEQTVAIKFVRGFAERATAQALMDSERRLLARLQHPGVARILDGGTTPEGLQFLVMEFVRGVPVDEHVRAAALPARARVALIQEVCAALAEAHRQLVLHCDIKPSNILIGEDGHAKLIDFGIARLQGAMDSALPHGYTRGYASPQRLAGEPPVAADDIYALGLLLVELVTSRLPADTHDVVADQALDHELAAIARRALDPDVQRRYRSVDEFADDLQRWQERRPIAALPPHWRYRLRKLVQRHPWRAVVVALATSALVLALGVISVLYARADAARHDAEDRFAQVRELANYLLFDLDTRLEATPGTTALRRELVEHGERYLDMLARTASNDPALAREVAVGLGRLADVQGGWSSPHMGERAAARRSFERAETLLNDLVQQHPKEWSWRGDLGRLLQRMADFYGGVDNDSAHQLSKAREAEAQLRHALADAQAAAAAPPALAELHNTLNASRVSQAYALDWLDQGQAAIDIARDELARLASLAPEVQERMPFDYRQGRTAVQLADSLFYRNQFAEALAAYRAAQARYSRAAATTPNDRKPLDSQAVALWGSSLTLTELGRHAEALEDIDGALVIARRLLELDPSNDNTQRQVLILTSDRGWLLGRLGRLPEAIALTESGLQQRRALAGRKPDISEPARDALMPLNRLADLYWRAGDLASGCDRAFQAIEGWAAYEKRFGLTDLERRQNIERERETRRRCPS